MYKFEITASSSKELELKQHEFARSFLKLDKVYEPETGPMTNVGSPELPPVTYHQNVTTFPTSNPSTITATEVVGRYADQFPAVKKHLDVPVAPITAVEAVVRQAESLPVSIPSVLGELDSRGLPWDARIHSGGKSQNKDGSWKNMKGVDKVLLANVEQELIAKIKSGGYSQNTSVFTGSEHPVVIPAVPATPSNLVVAPFPTFAQSNPETRWDNVAPAPAQTVAVVTPQYQNITIPQLASRPAHNLATFKNNLHTLLAQLITEKKIDQPYIESLCKYFGIQNIWNVIGNEAQTIELFNCFVKNEFITQVG